MNVIIDYHAGNLFNLKNALDYLGISCEISQDPKVIQKASRLLFPGVGAFDAAMKNLEALQLVEPIHECIQGGTPFLGICVGMQLLYALGTEKQETEGLGCIPGRVTRFEHDLKIPHMGWNQATFSAEQPLFKDIPDQSYFYFVHSYHGVPEDPSVAIAETHYGIPFVSAVQQQNVWGVQFHPEKSQDAGLQLLKNFCNF